MTTRMGNAIRRFMTKAAVACEPVFMKRGRFYIRPTWKAGEKSYNILALDRVGGYVESFVCTKAHEAIAHARHLNELN